MDASNEQMEYQSWHLDPNRPESWGEEVSRAEDGESAQELPVRLSVLVRKGHFVGLRGPRRLLDAVYDHYLIGIDPMGILINDSETESELVEH
jgi:hypothetical protein